MNAKHTCANLVGPHAATGMRPRILELNLDFMRAPSLLTVCISLLRPTKVNGSLDEPQGNKRIATESNVFYMSDWPTEGLQQIECFLYFGLADRSPLRINYGSITDAS